MPITISEEAVKGHLGELSSNVVIKAAANGNVQISMSKEALKATSQVDIWRTFVAVVDALEAAQMPFQAHASWFKREDQSRVPWPHIWVNQPTAEETATVQRDERLTKVENTLDTMAQLLSQIVNDKKSNKAPSEDANAEQPF